MRNTFFCIDGHTAGNPVRLVAGGAPLLRGETMLDRRQDFLERFAGSGPVCALNRAGMT